MRNVTIALSLLMLCLSGCAKYEYALVRPPELARHIGRGIDQVFKVEPLEYRLRTVDNRLVMRVFNPTNDAIELLGPKCSVVDPSGQSHPLRSSTIAPQSFIKLIFPPTRPRAYAPYHGPTWGTGIGVGMRVDATEGRQSLSPPPVQSEPLYLQVYDEGDTYYWDWKGQGEARLTLVYRRGEEEIRHDFLFRRKKM